MQNNITISYQDERVSIETIIVDHDIQYQVNFEHPIFLEKAIDDEGNQFWIEVGTGPTLRATEIGEIIEKHPEFI